MQEFKVISAFHGKYKNVYSTKTNGTWGANTQPSAPTTIPPRTKPPTKIPALFGLSSSLSIHIKKMFIIGAPTNVIYIYKWWWNYLPSSWFSFHSSSCKWDSFISLATFSIDQVEHESIFFSTNRRMHIHYTSLRTYMQLQLSAALMSRVSPFLHDLNWWMASLCCMNF